MYCACGKYIAMGSLRKEYLNLSTQHLTAICIDFKDLTEEFQCTLLLANISFHCPRLAFRRCQLLARKRI